MIEAFQNYFIHQYHFEENMSDEAGREARRWLSEIRRAASSRREEIQQIRTRNRKIRNGLNGRPPKDKYSCESEE